MSDLEETQSPRQATESPTDGFTDAQGEHSPAPLGLDPPLPPKRKGGRKPIYATSEERKQRNRQAQAAFRERRTEYIKQLEVTTKEHDDTVDELRQKNQMMSDEYASLQYRMSLLEQLLDDNSIDFRSLLAARSSQPSFKSVNHTALHRSGSRSYPSHDQHHFHNGYSIDGLAPKPSANSAPAKGSATSKRPMASPPTSLHSPSSFIFPDLSPQGQDFPNHSPAQANRRWSEYSTLATTAHDSVRQYEPSIPSRQSFDQRLYPPEVDHSRTFDYKQPGSYDYHNGMPPPRFNGNFLAPTRARDEPIPDTSRAQFPPSIESESTVLGADQMPSGFVAYPFDEMRRQAVEHRAWLRQNGSNGDIAQ